MNGGAVESGSPYPEVLVQKTEMPSISWNISSTGLFGNLIAHLKPML